MIREATSPFRRESFDEQSSSTHNMRKEYLSNYNDGLRFLCGFDSEKPQCEPQLHETMIVRQNLTLSLDCWAPEHHMLGIRSCPRLSRYVAR